MRRSNSIHTAVPAVRWFWRRWAVLIPAVIVITAAAWGEPPRAILFSEDFESGLGKDWQPVEFGSLTQYSVEREGSNSVLKASAKSSASGLAVKREIEVTPNLQVEFRWKIDKTPLGANEFKLEKFDHTARVYIAFKTLLGPPRTINYVWACSGSAPKTFEHPRSGRARCIALQVGDAKAGEWIAEKRNIQLDWNLLFGSGAVPPIEGIGVMTDSDGTKSDVTGWYDDIVLSRAK